ncbi:MAG: hypothetical protein ACI81L_001386 [Verrucomicrobiales bacterium]|jgi:hypothetical protein
MDQFAPPTSDERSTARETLTAWLDGLSENPVVAAVVKDEESEAERWFVRVNGEAKDVYSVWFDLGQRTLAYETYVMPAPEENEAAFYEQLLVRNDSLRELAFTIGEEHAVFLKGRTDLRHVSEESLDRILGSVYEAIERCFVPAIRIGFATRFAG